MVRFMAVDDKYVEVVKDKEEYDAVLEDLGIEAEYKPASDNGIDLSEYTQTLLSEMYNEELYSGKPVLSDVYVNEWTNKNTGETQVQNRIDLVLLDDTYEDEKEAYIFQINLPNDEDIQENISNLSKLYPLVTGLMELQVKGISDYYNTIKKVSLKALQKKIDTYSEMTVKVVEKRFVDKNTKEENFYNSYVITEGEKE